MTRSQDTPPRIDTLQDILRDLENTVQRFEWRSAEPDTLRDLKSYLMRFAERCDGLQRMGLR